MYFKYQKQFFGTKIAKQQSKTIANVNTRNVVFSYAYKIKLDSHFAYKEFLKQNIRKHDEQKKLSLINLAREQFSY